MAEPVGAAGDWLARNTAIIIGLGIGTAAKYGLTLTEGKKLTWKGVLADLLLLGILGAIATSIADLSSLTGNNRVLVGALAAVSSDRLVRLYIDRFLSKVEPDLGASAKASPATAMRVPAGVGEPSEVLVQPGIDDSNTARTGGALKQAFRDPTRQRLPRDQADMIRKLGDDL